MALQLTREIVKDEDGVTLLPAFDGTRRVVFKLSPAALEQGLGISPEDMIAVDDAIRIRWSAIEQKCLAKYVKDRQGGRLVYITMTAVNLY